jgi:protein-S-isoprenylcysteine O-methyltransferase Ste14
VDHLASRKPPRSSQIQRASSPDTGHYIAAFLVGVALALIFSRAGRVIVIVDRFVIAREEPYLERTLAQAYRDHKARVRRWL